MTDDAWAHERTLVLADDARLADLDRYAAGRDWPRVTDLPGGYGYLRQVGWSVGAATVLWLESGRLGARFVCVAGPSAADVDPAAEAVGAVLPVVTEDATLAELTAAEPAEPRTALRAVHRLAAGYEIRRLRGMPAAPDDRYRLMAERVLAHTDPTVRHALMMLFADLMTVRPEVVAPIVAHADPDPGLAPLVDVFREIAVDKGIPVP